MHVLAELGKLRSQQSICTVPIAHEVQNLPDWLFTPIVGTELLTNTHKTDLLLPGLLCKSLYQDLHTTLNPLEQQTRIISQSLQWTHRWATELFASKGAIYVVTDARDAVKLAKQKGLDSFRFVHKLHSIPAQRALALGLEKEQRWRQCIIWCQSLHRDIVVEGEKLGPLEEGPLVWMCAIVRDFDPTRGHIEYTLFISYIFMSSAVLGHELTISCLMYAVLVRRLQMNAAYIPIEADDDRIHCHGAQNAPTTNDLLNVIINFMFVKFGNQRTWTGWNFTNEEYEQLHTKIFHGCEHVARWIQRCRNAARHLDISSKGKGLLP